MTTKITAANLDSTLSTAISQGGGPKITNIQVTDNSYTVLDDTAVDLAGGYIKITGTGFATGCQVLIGTTAATSTTFVSATEVRAQVPAMTAGTYIVYLVNSDGGVTIRVNGLTYSASPTWSTNSSLTTQTVDQAISIQLSASGASTYSLAAGSSLPAGLTLTSGGLLAGTVTGLIADTTYTFTVLATDTEYQDSPRQFSLFVTIIVTDPYFNSVSLLLPGTGTNNATNNTFVDSSTNNFTITRNGNPTQGTYSPYSPAGWSNYFDGDGDYLTVANNAAFDFGTNDFTLEFWAYIAGGSTQYPRLLARGTFQDASSWAITVNTSSKGVYFEYGTTPSYIGADAVFELNTWNHFAVTRSGTTCKVFVNGVLASSNNTVSNSFTNSSALYIGRSTAAADYLNGYISDLRIVKGTAVYTSNFTPPTAPLTAIANTSLLTCQSNRFKDNSTNAFAITANGDTRVTNWAPFAPTAAWSAAASGGSAYFDGTGDYLSIPNDSQFQFNNSTFTVEGWVYILDKSNTNPIIGCASWNGSSGNGWALVYNGSATKFELFYISPSFSSLASSAGFQTSQWYHIAVVRNSTTITMYVNGTSAASGTINVTNSTNPLMVGAFTTTNGWNSNSYATGYFSGLRIVKGTAVYTTNFTPPTAPVTAIANTSLLLNATNAGITDAATRNVIETVGDAKISTAQSKWGGSSMSFDGTGDYLYPINASASAALGSGNWTVEFWLYTAAGSTTYNLLDYRPTSTNGVYLTLYLNSGVPYVYVNNSNLIVGGAAILGTTWTHIAICKSGSSTKLFVNGTQSGSTATDTNNYLAGNNRPAIGGGGYDTASTLNGYISDLRITKGVARYTANFTPPTRALPTQ